MPNLTVILALLLALSVAGNAWLFHSRDLALERSATAEQATRDTAVAAKACSDSVEGLAKAGRDRHAALVAALEANRGQVEGLKRSALVSLAAQPSDPGNLCASLERFLRAEIKKEAKP